MGGQCLLEEGQHRRSGQQEQIISGLKELQRHLRAKETLTDEFDLRAFIQAWEQQQKINWLDTYSTAHRPVCLSLIGPLQPSGRESGTENSTTFLRKGQLH